MSLYDKASLVMIPSGYKASSATLYSVVPNTSVGDFDVTVDADATRVNKDGLIESVAANQARLDYPLTNGVVGDCPHLLLEPTSTNYTTRSEEFDNSYWTKSNTTVTANQEIAPDGVLTADKILETTASSSHIIYSFVTGTSGNNTFSVFVKPINRKKIRLAQNLTVNSRADFDIDTLSVSNETGGATGKIEKFSNGWFRLSISFSATFTSMLFAIYILDDSGNNSYTGNTSNGFYLWGAMNEYLPYPTSYIPTSGSAVTRTAETCNGAGDSSTFNDSEGVLFAEIANIDENNTTDTVSISISDGTLNNSATLYYFATGDIYYDIFNSSGTRSGGASMTKSEQSNFNKIALKYKSTDISLWVNGFELSTNSGTLALSGLSELAFDYGGGTLPFYGKVKQLMVFNEALSDSELQQLTS